MAAHDRGDYQEALDAYKRAEDLAPDIVSRARLLNSRARTEWYSGRPDAGAALWQRVLDAYDELLPQRWELAAEIAKALTNKAIALYHAGHHEASIVTSDNVIARFGTATELPLRELVADATVLKARLHKC